MESIDGLERLHMSGRRAVFVPLDAAPDETLLEDALAAKGLELTRYERVSRPRAGGVVLVGAGVT